MVMFPAALVHPPTPFVISDKRHSEYHKYENGEGDFHVDLDSGFRLILIIRQIFNAHPLTGRLHIP